MILLRCWRTAERLCTSDDLIEYLCLCTTNRASRTSLFFPLPSVARTNLPSRMPVLLGTSSCRFQLPYIFTLQYDYFIFNYVRERFTSLVGWHKHFSEILGLGLSIFRCMYWNKTRENIERKLHRMV